MQHAALRAFALHAVEHASHRIALGAFGAWFAIGCPVCNKIALLALGTMMAQPFVMELIPVLSRERLFGTYFGFYSVASAIGVTVGNTLTGAAFDTGQDGDLAGLPWLLMILLGLASTIGVATLDYRGQLNPAVAAR